MFLPKKMIFLSFSQYVSIFDQSWYQKRILWLISIPEMCTFIYITVIIRTLQHAIFFTISGLTLPLTCSPMGYSIWNPYTPCRRFWKSVPLGSVNFQIHLPYVWFLGQVYLGGSEYLNFRCQMSLFTWKSHSSCTRCFLKSSTGGVWIKNSNGAAQFIMYQSTIEAKVTMFYLYFLQHHRIHTQLEQHHKELEGHRTDHQVKGQGAIVEGHRQVVQGTPIQLTQQAALRVLEGMMVRRLLSIELLEGTMVRRLLGIALMTTQEAWASKNN